MTWTDFVNDFPAFITESNGEKIWRARFNILPDGTVKITPNNDLSVSSDTLALAEQRATEIVQQSNP